MGKKVVLRLISLVMLIAAVVFVIIAVSCPTLGRVFYIGSFRVDGEVLEVFYICYLVVMMSFIGKKEKFRGDEICRP